MTLHDVRRLSDYSKTHPSARQLLAACAVGLGATLPEQESEKPKPIGVEQARAWAYAASKAVNPNG